MARKSALKRDGGRCRFCGLPATEVHHILYRSGGGSDEDANLISLCGHCHREAHAGRRGPRWFLHLTVQTGLSPLLLRQALLGYGHLASDRNVHAARVCLSCHHREAWVCGLWDQEVTPEYRCDAWVLRDKQQALKIPLSFR